MSSIRIQPRLVIAFIFVAVSSLCVQSLAAAAQLSLSWVDNSADEEGFTIERKTEPNGAYGQISTTAANVTTYLDASVAAGTTYCYRVRAFNLGGASNSSNEACGATPSASPPSPSPSPPPPSPQTYSVTISVVGQGVVASNPAGISCAPTCQKTFSSGVAVAFTARSNTGWQFRGWEGRCAGHGATCSLTINQATNITANFARVAETTTTLSSFGTFRNGIWSVDNKNFRWEGCAVDTCVTFGAAGDQPVMGYWGTSARKHVGVFRQGAWYLDNGNRRFDGCSGGDICLSLGASGDQAAVGDMNGDGKTDVGVFNNGSWRFDTGNYRWDDCTTDICINGFGTRGDQAVVGDWNGDGRAEIGVYRDGIWFLDKNGNRRWDGCRVDQCAGLGRAGDYATVGDWDGDRKSQIGVLRGGQWILDNGNGIWEGCTIDKCVNGFGAAGDLPVSRGP
jgi:hypothetical protein